MRKSEALNYRKHIENAVQSLPANDALTVVSLHPSWAEGVAYKAGIRLNHGGKLYEVVTAHTSQADWIPGVGTESLYKQVNETSTGTLGDPIPYEGNMELTEGVYYTQAGVTYLCTRSTGQPVYNALSELVGLYVEVAA